MRLYEEQRCYNEPSGTEVAAVFEPYDVASTPHRYINVYV